MYDSVFPFFEKERRVLAMLNHIIVEEVKKLMAMENYSPETIRTYEEIWKSFIRFTAEKYNIDEFNLTHAFDFLDEHCNCDAYDDSKVRTPRERRLYRAIVILNVYNATGALLPKYKSIYVGDLMPVRLNECYIKILDEYSSYVESRNLKNITANKYIGFAKRLLIHFQTIGIDDIATVTLQDCYDYFISRDDLEKRSVGRYLIYTNDFFSYLCMSKINANVPNNYIRIAGRVLHKKIPSAWSLEDLNLLINAVDRSTPMGKRQYAMILLAAVVGIRIGDIKRLTVYDVNWKDKTVSFVQSKTCKPITVQLPKIVFDAVCDYLLNGRPMNYECSNIFISHRKPFGPLPEGYSLYRTVTDNMKKAGIKKDENRHCGFHSLRHTNASLLLAEGAPLPVISSILGHSSVDSTAVYLKIDIEKLKECVLPPIFEEGDNNG
jgi:site-specific recombinase XerD